MRESRCYLLRPAAAGAAIGGDARTAALDALHATLDAHQTAAGALYRSATWLIVARRI